MRQWQAIRGMWGKRAAAEAMSQPLAMDSLSRGLWGKRAAAKSMMSEPFNANSLVGNPFAFTVLGFNDGLNMQDFVLSKALVGLSQSRNISKNGTDFKGTSNLDSTNSPC